MRLSTIPCIAAITAVTVIALAVPLQAGSIAVTYNLTGTGTVQSATDTTLTLAAVANGSVLSGNPGLDTAWNPVTYSDESVLDLKTNLLNGNFSLTFADGDTLVGKIFEDDTAVDTSANQTGPFSQTLTFTGGTGEFAGATGSVSGEGFLGTTVLTVSGRGSIDTPTVPEPAPMALLLGGLGLISVKRWWPTVKSASEAHREL